MKKASLNFDKPEPFLNARAQIVEWAPDELNQVSEAIEPTWNEWIAVREKKGLPAKKLVDDMYAILEGLSVENPPLVIQQADREALKR